MKKAGVDGGKTDFWEENTFFQTMSGEEAKKKLKTLHKSHDEDVNYNCGKCGKKISAHTRDWHACLCDDCFDKEYW